MNKKLLATFILCLMLLGTFLTMHPQQVTMKILHSGFLAATIGGLADWFAITALFKKPLGITYCTRIIPRKRKVFIEEIVRFVGNDLMSRENIIANLQKYDTAQMLIAYLKKSNGQKRIQEAFMPFMKKAIENIDVSKLAYDKLSFKLPINSLLAKSLGDYLDGEDLHGPADKVVDILQEFCASEEFKNVLEENIAAFLADYAGENSMRQMAMNMFGIDAPQVTNEFLAKTEQYFQSLHDDPQKMDAFAEEFVREGKNLLQSFSVQTDAKEQIVAYLIEVPRQASGKISNLCWSGVENIFVKFLGSMEMQRTVDAFIKKTIEKYLPRLNVFVCEMVESKLNSYSEEEFVSLIEEKISDDLQMIRINGSIVGGVAGILLSALALLVSEVLH